MTYEQALWTIEDRARAAEHNAEYYERVGNVDDARRERCAAELCAVCKVELDANERLDAADAVERMRAYERRWREGETPLGLGDVERALAERLRVVSGFVGALAWESPRVPPPYTKTAASQGEGI